MKLSRRQALYAGAALGALFASGCASTGRSDSEYPEHADEAARERSRFWRAHDRELIAQLELAPNANVLDAGCGSGDHALLLAERAPLGRVTALDLSEAAIAALRARIASTRFERRVTPQVGDITALPFAAASFDAAWSSHVLHFMADPVACVRELARVVRPGGLIAVREDRALLHCLPLDVGLAAPGIEERVNSSFEAWFAEDLAQRGRVTMGWLGVLRAGGLHDVRAKSVLMELTPPFAAPQASYLRRRLARQSSDERVSTADRDALRELSTEGGPHDALARNDLHFVSVSSLYLGRV